MVLATNTHIMEHWNVYFWTAFLITLLVTVVGVRIRPLSKAPDTYYPGVSPRPEPVYSRGLVKNAWREAVDIAENADHPLRRIAYIQRETLGVLGTVATGRHSRNRRRDLYTYTPIFSGSVTSFTRSCASRLARRRR
jgi:hypothetical protein